MRVLCMKMSDYCDKCHDGEGGTIYPYYGVGPHICGWRMGKPVIGHSVGVPASQWPDNFQPDLEFGEQDDGKPPLGIWTHCLECGAGKQSAEDNLSKKLTRLPWEIEEGLKPLRLGIEISVAIGSDEAAEKYKEQIEITVKNFKDEIMKL